MKMQITVLVLLVALSAPALADGDPVAGKMVFKKCQACHTIDGPNRVGPNLTGLAGRQVASVDGFKYSKAMTSFGEGGKVWSVERLTKYLESPRTIVKGTSMSFAGVKKPEELANLIAYLSDPSTAQ